MSEKTCVNCGSKMGLGAPSAENVKVQYECWCGKVEMEFFTEEELKIKKAAAVTEMASSAGQPLL